LPEGILDYFELSKIVEAIPCLHICLEEKNLPPGEHKDQKLESRGFLPEIYIQDFPIRNQKVTLCIKRRRWEVKNTGEIISRDWNMVQQGTRMTKEFADFLSVSVAKYGDWPWTWQSTWRSAAAGLIVSRCFPKVSKVIDRVHVQNRTADAVSI
jgi:hypothetical protein